MTQAGLVERGSESSGQVRYELTKLGKGLMPVFKNLLTWGTKMMAAR